MESQPSAIWPLATRGQWASWRISSCQFDTHTETTPASPADPLPPRLLNSMCSEQKLIGRTNALAGTSRSSLWSEDPCKVMGVSLRWVSRTWRINAAQNHRNAHRDDLGSVPQRAAYTRAVWVKNKKLEFVHMYIHTYNFMCMGVLPVRMSVHHMHA